MKLKYFIFGLITSALILGASILLLLRYIDTKRQEVIQNDLTNNVGKLEFEVYSFNNIEESFLSSFDFISKSGLENKDLILVNFWATWCAPCISEIPSMIKISNQEGFKSHFDFIFSSNEEKEKINNFLKKKKWDSNFSFFDEKLISNTSFKHSSIPTTYIINRKKKLIYKISSIQNWNAPLTQDFLLSLIP